MVQGRQQRVICLLHLHRTAEALAEIDGILTVTDGAWPVDDPMLAELRVVRSQLQPA